jgi:PAS domain S-box-containing protein
MITDLNAVIVFVNRRFSQVSGFPARDIMGTSALNQGTQDAGEQRAMWDQLADTGSWKGRFRNTTAGGAVYEEEAEIKRITTNENGNRKQYYLKVARLVSGPS